MSLNAHTNIHCLSLSVTHVPARSRACMRAFSLCLSVTLSFFPSHSFFLCLTLFLSHSHLPTKSLHLHTHTRVREMTLARGSTDSRWMWQRTEAHSKTQCIVLCDGQQRTVHCSIGCIMLKFVAVCWMCCSVLQRTATHSALYYMRALLCAAVRCCALLCVAVCCV